MGRPRRARPAGRFWGEGPALGYGGPSPEAPSPPAPGRPGPGRVAGTAGSRLPPLACDADPFDGHRARPLDQELEVPDDEARPGMGDSPKAFQQEATCR